MSDSNIKNIKEERTMEANRTCMRCVDDYKNYTGRTTFDYSMCLHCHVSQTIHETDTQAWNGYCRFLR